MKNIYTITCISLFCLAACQDNQKQDARDGASARVYLDTAGIDRSVKPGDNFYQYANGKWQKNTVIPKSDVSWGPWEKLRTDISKQVRGILEQAAKSNAIKNSAEQKIGDLYASGMDSLTLEKLGAEPIKPSLAQIDSIKNFKDIITFAASASPSGESTLFKVIVEPDDKISTKNIISFYQGGFIFPEKNYYTDLDKQAVATRAAYRTYIIRLFTLNGDSLQAPAYADNIIKLETLLANSHYSGVDANDPQKVYHKFAVADFQLQTPNINWASVLNKLGTHVDTMMVREPSYYQALSQLVKSQPVEFWKQKLKFDLMAGSSRFLNDDFRFATYDFYGSIFGNMTRTERWRDVSSVEDDNLGDLVGQVYVKRYFTADAKERMLTLVNNLQRVYAGMITKADWMAPETKKTAIAKLNSMVKKIGYPDKWKNYEGVKIVKETYYVNVRSAKKNAFKLMIEELKHPIDKTAWNLTPQSAGGYNNSAFNEIVFPAGSLQYPFFDPKADDAVNYGAIGMVIGHEITHGFDDYGRQYDAAGTLRNWWTKADVQQFNDRAAKVVAFYDKINVLDNQHVNGALTLTENIADLGGVNIAYQAFKQTSQGKSNKKIDGFTPDQRFFLAFAQCWRTKATSGFILQRLKSDTHSPDIARINACVFNMEPFYQAFQVPTVAKMYVAPANRIGIW